MPENELPHHSRLTYPGEEGEALEAAAIKASQDELEASELRKAIEKSKLEGKFGPTFLFLIIIIMYTIFYL